MRRKLFLFLLAAFAASPIGWQPAVAQSEKERVESPPVLLSPPPAKTAPAQPPAEPPPKIEIRPLDVGEIPFEPRLLTRGLSVELMIDGSGSMNGFLGSESKIESLRSDLQDLIGRMTEPDGEPIELGIRVFGSSSPVAENNCQDSRLLLPVGPIDRDKIGGILPQIQAQGTAPIALSLQKAALDFTDANRDNIIILVADGKDSCGQDACSAAQEIYRTSRILTHVIAFDIPKEDEAALKCVADAGRGTFFTARTREELLGSLDEALRLTIPYNLRLQTLVGGSPLPCTLTIYEAGTQKVVKRKKSFGTELLRLDAGSYDILVEYAGSIEKAIPSKIIKGVELTAGGKVEQEIRFELASMTLSALDDKGQAASAQITLFAAGTNDPAARFQMTGEEAVYYLSPGSYDLVAVKTGEPAKGMTLTEKGNVISMEQGYNKTFLFQAGTLVLKGKTSMGDALAVEYKVTPPNKSEAVLLSGKLPATGGKIELAPGEYDIFVTGSAPQIPTLLTGKIEKTKIASGEIREETITLPVGKLKLTAVKGGGASAESLFKVTDEATGQKVAEMNAKEGSALLVLAPGTYTAESRLISETYEEGPTLTRTGITVTENQEAAVELSYLLGTLKLLGRNAREQQLNTQFFVYAAATENVVASSQPQKGWVQFDLGPGVYDIKGVNLEGKAEAAPIVWQRDLLIVAGSMLVREIVFTNAKLRLIGRGANGEIIPVFFHLYQYGHDRPLIKGETGQDWQSFDLIPGSYYIEARFHDPESAQELVKWVSLKVEENAYVEKELRF